ncbi:MAG: site-specific integrase [Acidobacteria bacterium]|nr:site-specific integrase [Acidobacteriota bacterium]
MQLLKNVVKKAVEWGKIKANNISSIKPLKTPPGWIRYLQLDQIPKLMKACPAWLKPIVLIDMNSGMRRGEILGLQRQNINKKTRLIILEKTKNNQRRVIPMNQTVYSVLKSLPPRLDTTYLFADADSEPLEGHRVSVAFKRACKKAKIEDFRLHDLRHHFASHLTMKGQNQRTIQELLGHKDPKMTMRYYAQRNVM